MTIEEALTANLLANKPLNTLIDKRLYPQLLPQNGELPAVMYQRISTVAIEDRDSAQPDSQALSQARFQFDVVAADAKAMWAVAKVLRQALYGLIGTADPRIGAVFIDNQYDFYEDTSRFSRVSVDAILQYVEEP